MPEPKRVDWNKAPRDLRQAAGDNGEDTSSKGCAAASLCGLGIGLILAGAINPLFIVLGIACLALALTL